MSVALPPVKPACDATRSFCRCDLPLGHEGPHICVRPNELGDGPPCGGSWLVEGAEIVTYAWPRTGFPDLDALAPPLPYREPWADPGARRGMPIQFIRPPDLAP